MKKRNKNWEEDERAKRKKSTARLKRKRIIWCPLEKDWIPKSKCAEECGMCDLRQDW